jgi:hypothetical protein
MLRVGGSGTTCAIYLLEDIVEVLFVALVVGGGFGRKSFSCSLQLNLHFGMPSSDVWCCRSCLVLRSGYLAACALFGGCFAVVFLGGYFVAEVAPLTRILCRVASGECFATVLLVDLVRADTPPS